MVSFLAVCAIILSYVIGSLSFSTLVGRWVAHIDIRKHGSGNAGATNTLRVLGLKWGLFVLALDISKGVMATLMAGFLPNTVPLYVYGCGLAVIAGHNWPLFFRFRGGKGVATTIGVLFMAMFHPALIAGIFALILVILVRFVSLGSLTFTTLVAVLTSIMHPHLLPIVFTSVVAVFSILRHRQNIVRLWNGTERRVFAKTETK
jgi:glycerol-3-phosphate acyltransferase PlsY